MSQNSYGYKDPKDPISTFQFGSLLNPEQAMERLKQSKEYRLQLIYFEQSKDEISFDIRVKHDDLIVLKARGYLYPVKQDDGNLTTFVKLDLHSQITPSSSVSIDSSGKYWWISYVVIGVVALVVLNPLLQSLGIDTLSILSTIPVVKYNAFLFQLLCVGGVGFGVMILFQSVFGILFKQHGTFTKSDTMWYEVKIYIQSLLTDSPE